jgi:hypothetical protein
MMLAKRRLTLYQSYKNNAYAQKLKHHYETQNLRHELSENILEVAALLPDYMGFIFWERSSRYFEGQIQCKP